MPLRFTLRQLEYVVAVAETGSIARASQALHVSSPSISAAIAQVEAEFGVQLFLRRHAHALVPTRAGRELVAEARAVLRAAEGLMATAGNLGEGVAGPLAVGCLNTFAAIVLPGLRRGFEALHPAVRVTQVALDHAGVLERLTGGEIDLGLTYDLPMPPEVVFRPLARLDPVAVMAPDHPLADRPSVALEDLAPHPMVLLDMPHSAEYFLSLFADRGLSPRIAERSDEVSTLRGLVANGFGYSLLNFRSRMAAAPDGRPLAFVPLEGPLPALRLGIARMEGTPRRAVTAFVEHCTAEVAAQGLPGCL